MLNEIKLKLNIKDNSKDLLLSLLIEEAEEYIQQLTNRLDYPKTLVKNIVLINYNKLGSEGISSESYNGASQSFMNDLPKDLKRQIFSVRKM